MSIRSSGGQVVTPPASPTPVATPGAVLGRAPGTQCPTCRRLVLDLLSADRAKYGLPPLSLQVTQSTGTPGCVGAYGHSAAMAASGMVWHVNAKYPRASFPQDICVPSLVVGENVGASAGGGVGQDLQLLNRLMMSEPHTRSVCSSAGTHACNILNPRFHAVGIGVYRAHNVTWLTEDFTG